MNDLSFILNILVNNTNDISFQRQKLKEYCKGNKDLENRINNVLELLKIGE